VAFQIQEQTLALAEAAFLAGAERVLLSAETRLPQALMGKRMAAAGQGAKARWPGMARLAL
jgi:hypothetical protein